MWYRTLCDILSTSFTLLQSVEIGAPSFRSFELISCFQHWHIYLGFSNRKSITFWRKITWNYFKAYCLLLGHAAVRCYFAWSIIDSWDFPPPMIVIWFYCSSWNMTRYAHLFPGPKCPSLSPNLPRTVQPRPLRRISLATPCLPR